MEDPSGKIYARTYEPCGGSEDLRKEISKSGSELFGNGYKAFCVEYLKTSSPQVFFKASPLSDESLFQISCFVYAFRTFGSALENPMKDLQRDAVESIDSFVKKYFKPVETPQDGDLVIYSVSLERSILTRCDKGTTHAGIYRETEDKPGGSVESKWGWVSNPYIFVHDVFFVPDFYGDVVKFYRLSQS